MSDIGRFTHLVSDLITAGTIVVLLTAAVIFFVWRRKRTKA